MTMLDRPLHLFAFRASLAGLALAACNQGGLPARDLGDTSAPLAGEAPPERRALLAGVGVDPFVQGTWVGVATDPFGAPAADGTPPPYVFPSGSSDIILELSLPAESATGETFPVGSITFGASPAPEPERGVPFPPEHDYYSPAFTAFVGVGPVFAPAEGFPYAIGRGLFPVEGELTNGLLPLSFEQNAPFAAWCPLQPSLADGAGSFSCSGGSGFSGGLPPAPEPCLAQALDGSEEVIDCNLAVLCRGDAEGGGVCQCDENGCDARPGRTSHLWLVREGDDLVGNFVGAVFQYPPSLHLLPVGSVRFQRVSP